MKILLPILTLFIVSGCGLVPGSNIDIDAYGQDRQWFETDGVWFPGLNRESAGAADSQLADLIDIVSINASLLSSASFQAQQTSLPSVPAALSQQLVQEIENYDYRIAPGDVLSITVYEHPELTIPAGGQRSAEESGNIVQSDGTIFYPFIREVEVEGLTINELRVAISSRLAEYIADPQVDVKVISYRSKRVYVTGQVNQPGPQAITNVPLTVMDAITNAGGLTDNANWHEVLLSRNGEESRLSLHEMFNNGRLGQNLLLRHGDVLHVPDLGEQQVFVLGELNSVDVLPMGNIRMSLTEALARSGGLNQVTSNASGVFVIRRAAAEEELLASVYQLDVRNAVAFTLGAQFILEPMDIVYVTTAPVTRWNRIINQLVPSITTILAIDNLSQ